MPFARGRQQGMDDVAGRDASARQAGHIIYHSVSTSGFHSGSQTHYGATSRPQEVSENQLACCGIMSPSRRTFCLMMVFDLILTFILWVIYVEVSVDGDFHKEVLHYNFRHSLFDTVMCAAWRCVPLLLSYGLWRINKPWAVAISTLGTCIFLVCKVFLFDFSVSKNVICYLLLITSFIVAWIETWFLDFKVLPREQKTRERENAAHQEERRRLLGDPEHGRYLGQDNAFYSPIESREGSDTESHSPDNFRSVPNSRGHSREHSSYGDSMSLGGEEKEYIEQAKKTWNRSWEILHESEGWKLENGKDHDTGIVKFKTFPKIGKLFRLEGYIDAPPQLVFEELVIKTNQTHEWNPTVMEGKTLQVIDDCTDICYNVAAEAAGGLVASRDFVNLRHWETRSGIIFSTGSSVSHPEAPPCKTHVRGVNHPGGGWAFTAIPAQPNRCLFTWIVNTDLKGWIPQYVVDQAFSKMLIEFLNHLRQRMAVVQ